MAQLVRLQTQCGLRLWLSISELQCLVFDRSPCSEWAGRGLYWRSQKYRVPSPDFWARPGRDEERKLNVSTEGSAADSEERRPRLYGHPRRQRLEGSDEGRLPDFLRLQTSHPRLLRDSSGVQPRKMGSEVKGEQEIVRPRWMPNRCFISVLSFSSEW